MPSLYILDALKHLDGPFRFPHNANQLTPVVMSSAVWSFPIISRAYNSLSHAYLDVKTKAPRIPRSKSLSFSNNYLGSGNIGQAHGSTDLHLRAHP